MGVVGVNRRYSSVAAFLLVFLWLWVAFDRPYSFPSHIAWNIYSNSPQSAPVTDVFKIRPLDSRALKDLCSATEWNQNVTFVCDESFGGVAEVRNSVLSCVRLAIAAGASLVMPRIIVRGSNGEPISTHVKSMDYMFDEDHFLASIATSCPQLQVYETVRHIPNPQHAEGPVSLQPETLVKDDPAARAEQWRAKFYSWLAHHHPTGFGPIIVELGRVYLQYPRYADGEEMANFFGRILNIREDARNLATLALMKFSQLHSLQLELTNPILRRAFMGAYISTETADEDPRFQIDPVSSTSTSQVKIYLNQAEHANMSTVYIAADDDDDIKSFIHEAERHHITVHTKLDLLQGHDRAALLEMTADQQALVDFLILSKSSTFAGVGHSGYAWNLALRRHNHSFMKKPLHGPLMMNDELSRIYGPVDGNPQFSACMWP